MARFNNDTIAIFEKSPSMARSAFEDMVLRLTRRTKTLVISILGARFMARTLYKEGACHDFVRRDVIRNRHLILNKP